MPPPVACAPKSQNPVSRDTCYNGGDFFDRVDDVFIRRPPAL